MTNRHKRINLLILAEEQSKFTGEYATSSVLPVKMLFIKDKKDE